jgi:hypothetical protein
MKYFRFGVLILLAASCMGGCCLMANTTAKGPAFSEYKNVPQGKALVYIYRLGERFGYARKYFLSANDQKITKIQSGGYIPYIVEPGTVIFKADLKCFFGCTGFNYVIEGPETEKRHATLELKIEPGKVYYVKLFVEEHPSYFLPHLLAVSNEVGSEEIIDCKLLQPEQ